MARKSLSDEEIRMILAEELYNNSSEDEIEDDDYIPSDDDGEIDEIVPALDISDEEADDYQSIAEQTLAANENPQMSFTSKNKTENWTSNPQSDSEGRLRIHNIVREKSGPTRYAIRNVDDIASAFSLFFRDSLLQEICTFTNIEGDLKLKDRWKQLDIEELKKFIATLLLIGVYKSKGEPVHQLWSKDDGRPIFNAIFARNRFQEILRMMRFDNACERRQNRSPDKLQPIRKIFDLWNSTLQDAFIPGVNLTVDEQLLTFRGRCPFRQYIPSKPGKYGIKFWVICDSETSYALKLDIYKGKEPSEQRASNLGTTVVLNLSDSYKNSGRNITCDNFFTSLQLGRELLRRKLTLVGTIRKNRTELPTAFTVTKGRKLFSSMYGFQRDSTIVSYCPKKNKVVTLLSTMHNDKGIESPGETKPEIIQYYNSTKGGVDTMDQMVRYYSTKRMTRRWPMVVFFNMIDISAMNAIIIWIKLQTSLQCKKGVRRALLITLAKSLAGVTANNNPPLQKPVSSNSSLASENTNKRKRCYLCPSKKDRKSKIYCDDCQQSICGEHSVNICLQCKK